MLTLETIIFIDKRALLRADNLYLRKTHKASSDSVLTDNNNNTD